MQQTFLGPILLLFSLYFKYPSLSVWQNAWIKRSPTFSQVAPKIRHSNFFLKSLVSQNYPNVDKYLGHFWRNFVTKKPFKNSPIWSHCSLVKANCRLFASTPPSSLSCPHLRYWRWIVHCANSFPHLCLRKTRTRIRWIDWRRKAKSSLRKNVLLLSGFKMLYNTHTRMSGILTHSSSMHHDIKVHEYFLQQKRTYFNFTNVVVLLGSK